MCLNATRGNTCRWESLHAHFLCCNVLYAYCLGGALTLSEWKIWVGGLLVHIILCLFFFLSMLGPAASVAHGSGPVSARLWIEINTTDKAIKALFVPFVTTGWGLKQSVFYQCQRCDETWLTQEANGIKAPICQPCSRPDRSKRKSNDLYGNPKMFLFHFIFCSHLW